MLRMLALALACVALPAAAQTTTTVTTQPQEQPPPPPPSTTVTTQSSPPPTTTVRTGEDVGVSTAPSGRSAVQIIATDALYGGVAGALVGGGVTLIDQGNNWARNLMVGAGIGILAGTAYGVYESATQSSPRRAVADADPAASNVNGLAFTAMSTRF